MTLQNLSDNDRKLSYFCAGMPGVAVGGPAIFFARSVVQNAASQCASFKVSEVIPLISVLNIALAFWVIATLFLLQFLLASAVRKVVAIHTEIENQPTFQLAASS